MPRSSTSPHPDQNRQCAYYQPIGVSPACTLAARRNLVRMEADALTRPGHSRPRSATPATFQASTARTPNASCGSPAALADGDLRRSTRPRCRPLAPAPPGVCRANAACGPWLAVAMISRSLALVGRNGRACRGEHLAVVLDHQLIDRDRLARLTNGAEVLRVLRRARSSPTGGPHTVLHTDPDRPIRRRRLERHHSGGGQPNIFGGAKPSPPRHIDMSREPHDSATLSRAAHLPPCRPAPTTLVTPPPTPPTKPTTTPTARSSARGP
jgi:hypothetical protein